MSLLMITIRDLNEMGRDHPDYRRMYDFYLAEKRRMTRGE